MRSPVQLGLAAAHDGFGVRLGGDRRYRDRRTHPRSGPDRRRRARRRATLRGLLFAAATLVLPNSLRTGALMMAPIPAVNVSIDNVVAVPADKAYNELIEEAADTYKLDPHLIRSVMQTESAFHPFAISRAGALGLMQLMPALAAEYGVTNPFDARQNIMAGAGYLRWLLDRHHGNVPLALASYNAGPGAVARYGRVPPFPETQAYVKRITRLMASARRGDGD